MGAPEVTFPIVSALVKEIIFKGSFRYVVPAFVLRPSALLTTLPLLQLWRKWATDTSSEQVQNCLFLTLFFFARHTHTQPGDYELAIALVAQGKIDLKPLVTHR